MISLERVYKALPGLHAIMGYDSVSAFAGKGTRKASDLICKGEKLCSYVDQLELNLKMTDSHTLNIEKFVCRIYAKTGNDANEVRYLLFSKLKAVQSHSLPPTIQALKKHILRANYQATIWKHALFRITHICESNLEDHGWKMLNGNLSVDWTISFQLQMHCCTGVLWM